MVLEKFMSFFLQRILNGYLTAFNVYYEDLVTYSVYFSLRGMQYQDSKIEHFQA